MLEWAHVSARPWPEHPKNLEYEEEKTMATTSGFDLGPTIAWYTAHAHEIPRVVLPRPQGARFTIRGREHAQVMSDLLLAYWSLIPEPARDRSVLEAVQWNPPLWFHRDSLSGTPRPTTRVEEALSPTALIPGYTDYTSWPWCVVHLYQLPFPVNATKEEKRARIVLLVEAFIHELAHTFITPATHRSGYQLVLPSGRRVGGLDFITEFAEMAERHPPISHYASAYRNADGTFVDEPEKGALRAIGEELAETIAAYLLGFAYCGNGDDLRAFRPLGDRPEIAAWVQLFLDAYEGQKPLRAR